jgi:hypothetical protein
MNAEKGQEIDHKNHVGTDNRKSNLRFCEHYQNSHNKKEKKGTVSKYHGLSWNARDRMWYAHIRCLGHRPDGRKIYLGCFKSEDDAARAYDRAAKELYGEFAWLNFTPSAKKERRHA